MQERLSRIDWAKIICIWLMVSCHAGQQGFLLSFSYQFHMPTFFIISGYLFKPRGVRKELLAMFVPILFYGLINLAFSVGYLIYTGFRTGLATNCVWGGVIDYISVDWVRSLYCCSDVNFFQGFWFLEVLLFVRLLLHVRIMREYKIIIAAICILFCCVQPYLQIPSRITSLFVWRTFSVMPFVLLGLILKEKQVNLFVGSFEVKLIIAFIFFILTLIQGPVSLFGNKFGVNYSILFINACLGSYLLFNLCGLMPKRNWGTTLATGTLLILGVHGKIYPYLFKLFDVLCFNNPYSSLIIGLIVLMICYPFILWLERHSPILLGKLSKKPTK